MNIDNVNAILSAVNSTRDDVEPTNGDCLVAFVELIRQTLEPMPVDTSREFHVAIVTALMLDDVDSFSNWLDDRFRPFQ